jgi:hypothetical protein
MAKPKLSVITSSIRISVTSKLDGIRQQALIEKFSRLRPLPDSRLHYRIHL